MGGGWGLGDESWLKVCKERHLALKIFPDHSIEVFLLEK